MCRDRLLLKSRPATKPASRSLRVMALGVVVGAIAAGVFGLLYGMLDALFHADLHSVLSTVAYFSLCGAAAGLLLLVGARMIDPEGVRDLTSRAPRSNEQTTG